MVGLEIRVEDFDLAEPERRKRTGHAILIAHHDDVQRLRRQVASSRVDHLLDRHLLDALDERGEVVVGQIVERELRGGAGDLLGGFEVARVAARQRRAAERQLLAA